MFMVGPNVNIYQDLEQLLQSVDSLFQYQKTEIYYQPLGSVSLEKIAKVIINAACKGHWLLLDNLQLQLNIVPNLMSFLETIFDYEKDFKARLCEEVTITMED